jgi:hypothetical protein
MNGQTASTGSFFQSQAFWEIAFVIALVCIIGAHKITVEGMIGV